MSKINNGAGRSELKSEDKERTVRGGERVEEPIGMNTIEGIIHSMRKGVLDTLGRRVGIYDDLALCLEKTWNEVNARTMDEIIELKDLNCHLLEALRPIIETNPKRDGSAACSFAVARSRQILGLNEKECCASNG